MGNMAVRCYAGDNVVRVLRPNGRIVELEGQIRVEELMNRFPEHLVIQANCLQRDDTLLQQSRKVTILPPNFRLMPAHDYILYLIPPQFKKAVAESYAAVLSGGGKSCLQGDISWKSRVVTFTRKRLATVLKSSRALKAGEEEDCCRGESGQPLMSEDESDDTELKEYTWKPSLLSIEEARSARFSAAASPGGGSHQN